MGVPADDQGDVRPANRLEVPVPGLSRYAETDAAIASFWTWWAGVAASVARDFGRGDGARWAPRIAAHVADIHRDLAWEARAGRGSRFALCLSGSGDPALRVLAERWRHAAPPTSTDWEFYGHRIGMRRPGRGVLSVGDRRLDLSLLRVAIDRDDARERLHVEVFHPDFATMRPRLRDSVAFLILDHALGEDLVESWLGAVEARTEPLAQGGSVEELVAAVLHLQDDATGDVWGLVTADTADGPLFLTANFAAKRWRWPTFDARCDVVLPLRRPTPAGIPDPWEADELDAIAHGLSTALGDAAVFIAERTCNNVRTLHMYAQGDGPAPEALRRWATTMARPVEVRWAYDPDWTVLTHPV